MASIQTQMISFYAIFLSILLTTIIFFKVDSIETTSFSIDKFSPDQPDLIFQGSAYASNEKLILTEEAENSAVGRVLYSAPIQIWDSKIDKVVDFKTHFTFVIYAPDSNNAADGLAFFIAPISTKPARDGGYLGVFNSTGYDKTAQTVAVEFDTFPNDWDPSNGERHIGIDVNRIISQKTKPWSLQNGKEANVLIAFNGTTNELSVLLTYHNSEFYYTIRDVVPLKDIVPEWVRVGFSATTGSNYEAHEVLSWSFHSELNDTSSSKQVTDA